MLRTTQLPPAAIYTIAARQLYTTIAATTVTACIVAPGVIMGLVVDLPSLTLNSPTIQTYWCSPMCSQDDTPWRSILEVWATAMQAQILSTLCHYLLQGVLTLKL